VNGGVAQGNKKGRKNTMKPTHSINEEQSALWNGLAGRGWVDAQNALDRMFHQFENLLIDGNARRVLDVGCGTGGTTLAFAHRLGENGRCVGIDISEPMLAAARARAEHENIPATFIQADAQTFDFELEVFDWIASRFGVMFFQDPVQAFSNLRQAAAPGATLRFAAWRSPEENPFMTAAERAVAPFLPAQPARQPDAPGQFAFADPNRITRILEESGWKEIDIRRIDVPCSFSAADLDQYLARIGPLGRFVQSLDASTREQLLATVRSAFDTYVEDSEVHFTAACWLVGAKA
jgi:ubiquinone/menaquinone biosynthesis C-methylase UbiE